jgi:predicted Zn-dependent protease
MLNRILFRIANGAGVRARAAGELKFRAAVRFRVAVKFNAAVLVSLLLISQAALPCMAADEETQIKAVLDQYFDNQYEKAKKLCRTLLAAHPKSLTAHYLLGNICIKLNQVAEAEAAYKYCLRGGKGSTEAVNAYQALEQIYEQRRMASGSTNSVSNGSALPRPTAGTNHSSEEYVQEETARLQKDAKDKLEVKQRTLDDRLEQEQKAMQQQIANAPRGRRSGYFRQEYQAQVRAEYQERVDRLKKEFEREKDEINQACQKRIDGLTEYRNSIDSRRSNK